MSERIITPLSKEQTGRITILNAVIAFSSCIFATAIVTTMLSIEITLAIGITGIAGGVAGMIGMLQGKMFLDILNKSWNKT